MLIARSRSPLACLATPVSVLLVSVLLVASVAACGVDERQPGLSAAAGGGGMLAAPETGAPAPGAGVPGEAPPVAGLEPSGGCDDAAVCPPPGGVAGCIARGPRDCSSALDNDCDGRPDDSIDEVCRCVPGRSEACDSHPGLDGRGPCRAGSRTCTLGEGSATSSWGACEGAVGPAPMDDCSVAADDSNCDGQPSGGCDCTDGETAPCGPSTEDGLCQRGTTACRDGAFGPCIGAVFAAARDCASEEDNDCDGLPDDTLDGDACQCVPGNGQACAGNAGRSRCNAQGQCVPCLQDEDCLLVSGGRSSCASGQCIARSADGSPCREDVECVSGECRQQFPNLDGDQFPDMAEPSQGFCGSIVRPGRALARFDQQTDCCDVDERVFPEAPPPVPPADLVPLGGVRGYAEPNACGDFDYDCSNSETSVGRQVQTRPICSDADVAGLSDAEAQAVCSSLSGWSDDIPGCGEVVSFDSCSMLGGACIRAAIPMEPRVCF